MTISLENVLLSSSRHHDELRFHLLPHVRARDVQRPLVRALVVFRLLGAFAVRGDVPPGPVLLVDDTVNSRWTLTVVGAALRDAGAGAVFPLVLAQR